MPFVTLGLRSTLQRKTGMIISRSNGTKKTFSREWKTRLKFRGK
jgi:hypothetical protein